MIILSMVNFVTIVLSGSMSMAIYRRQGDISAESKPAFFGSAVKLSLLLIALAAMILLLLQRPLFVRWEISFSVWWFMPIVIYTGLMVIYTILYTIISIDLRFSFLMLCSGIYLLFSTMVIVCYVLMPEGVWTIGFLFGPAIAIAVMLNSLIKEKKLNFNSKLSWKFLKDFFGVSILFLITTMVANLLVYGDRWLLAEYGIPKSDIAIYSVAVQACVLILAILQQIAKVITPMVSNLKNYHDITDSHARKILTVTLLSVLFVAILGSVGGFLYIRIFFGEIYWVQCKTLFIIIFVGMAFYPLQIFSRPLLIRFHSLWLNLLIYIIACIILLVTISFLVADSGIQAFAFARQFTYIWIALASFVLAQRRLIYKLRRKTIR